MTTPRFITRLSYIFILAIVCLMGAASASAQSSSIAQAVQLSKSAMEDYDFLELESADTKLIQAVQIIENLGITDPGVANIYIAQGIVSYGRFKDTARAIGDERAFSAFLKALTLNPAVTIPSDYRSAELEAIFNRAKDTIAAAPASSPIAIQAVKPSIQHTGEAVNSRCKPLEIRANVPAHPDIYRVYVYYAEDGVAGYKPIEMHPTLETSDILTATIPGLATSGNKVHYYIEAQNRLAEVVAAVNNAQQPLTTEMVGECVGLSTEELAKSFGSSRFQFDLLVGTGLGIVSGELQNRRDSFNNPISVDTGVGILPFHIRAAALVNLPANFQIGLYLRGQIANIVSQKMRKDIYSDITPEVYNILVGLTARYFAVDTQPYRFYVGLGIGWGGANASVPLKNEKFIDLYLYKGPVHIAPELGFLWTFHKNVGLAVELDVPIYFPERPAVHFDLSVGPFFQF